MFKRKFFSGEAGMLSRVLLVGVCLFTLLSCNEKEEVRPLSGEGEDVEEAITIGAGVSLRTKATDAGFEMGDTLGIYLSKWKSASEKEELLASGNYADNAMFRLRSLPDSWESDKAYYYPADGSLLDFYAYYPYRKPCFASEGTVLDLRVSSDQSSYADYTRSDFMTSVVKGVRRSSGKVHLDFYHRLSQIVFKLIPGVGFTEDDLLSAQVKVVNAIVDARYDLSQKLDSFPMAGSERSSIVPCGSWVKGDGALQGVKAILVPQKINGGTYIEVSVGSRRFTFKPSSAIRMNPGCSREFTITVSNTGIDIETEIHPWDECPPVSGSTEEENVIVEMTTLADTLSFSIDGKGIEVDWGDGVREKDVFSHIYTDGATSHDVTFYGADTVLESLECEQSQLIDLKIKGNKKLTQLDCMTNQLTNLYISNNFNLTDIWCNHNKLSSLDVSDCVKLQTLNCDMNQLTSLNVTGCNTLISLYFAWNQLTFLDISSCAALNDIDCCGNPFVFDPDALTAFVSLLPDKSRQEWQGNIYIDESGVNDSIRSICVAKIWMLHERTVERPEV